MDTHQLRLINKFATILFFTISLLAFCNSGSFAETAYLHQYEWGNSKNLNTQKIGEIRILQNWQIKSETDQWQKTSVPLSFSGRRTGLTLRCEFNISEQDKNRDILLNSHGIHGAVRISLNGTFIHFQPANFTPFNIRLQHDQLNLDKVNILVFELLPVNNPRQGFPVFSQLISEETHLGIIRPIYLKILPIYRIVNFKTEVESFASEKCVVHFSYKINEYQLLSDQYEQFRIEESIETHDQTVLISTSSRLKKIPETREVRFKLSNSHGWTPDNPKPFVLKISLKSGSRTIFKQSSPFSIRHLNIQSRSISINKQPIQLRGVNYYQNLTIRTKSKYLEKLKEDFIQIKQFGFNAVRFPHYIPDAYSFYIADSLGLLLFPEIPIWQYPQFLYSDDDLLELSKNTILSLNRYFQNHPSFVSLGLGQEVPLHKGSVQKFFLILHGMLHATSQVPTYVSPVPGYPLPLRKITSFYLHDSYADLDISKIQREYQNKYLTAGNLGFLNKPAMRNNIEPKQNLDRLYFLRSEISKSAGIFPAGSGFIESFQDWKSNELNHATLGLEPDRVFQSGLYNNEGQEKYWAKNFETVWTDSIAVTSVKQNIHERTNFFSIFTFFAAIIFFAIYQRQSRLRENFRRSIKHPYNFFVDMRERRIIPLFNSILIGAFSSLLLAITLASVIYYYHNFYGLQEIFAIFLSPAGIFDSFLMLIASKWKLTALIFVILFLYPLFVSTILKLIGMLSIERIRFRQSLAIGLWSGMPLIFILPLSLSVYHLLYLDFYIQYVLFIIILFILWAHWRILTGIRVLFITRPAKVFIIMLLSYIIPLIIFWAVFKPYPNWFEYFKFLLNAQTLY